MASFKQEMRATSDLPSAAPAITASEHSIRLILFIDQFHLIIDIDFVIYAKTRYNILIIETYQIQLFLISQLYINFTLIYQL